jgi:hypothetical protein
MASPCPRNDFLCKTGDLLLPKSLRRNLETYVVGNEKTSVYVTYWSVIHFVSGLLIVYFFDTSYWNGFLIHTVWEIYQILIRNTPIHTLRGKLDIVMDTTLFMLGMVVGKTILAFEP